MTFLGIEYMLKAWTVFVDSEKEHLKGRKGKGSWAREADVLKWRSREEITFSLVIKNSNKRVRMGPLNFQSISAKIPIFFLTHWAS